MLAAIEGREYRGTYAILLLFSPGRFLRNSPLKSSCTLVKVTWPHRNPRLDRLAEDRSQRAGFDQRSSSVWPRGRILSISTGQRTPRFNTANVLPRDPEGDEGVVTNDRRFGLRWKRGKKTGTKEPSGRVQSGAWITIERRSSAVRRGREKLKR
ncbi:hypothetical protein KM043_000749 [Ampulex compressa]|nr:hypothetical protein KM043_000749 [Ampulex compressa]